MYLEKPIAIAFLLGEKYLEGGYKIWYP